MLDAHLNERLWCFHSRLLLYSFATNQCPREYRDRLSLCRFIKISVVCSYLSEVSERRDWIFWCSSFSKSVPDLSHCEIRSLWAESNEDPDLSSSTDCAILICPVQSIDGDWSVWPITWMTTMTLLYFRFSSLTTIWSTTFCCFLQR